MVPGDAGQEAEGGRVREESEGAFRLARRRSALDRLGRRLRRWFSGVEQCCEYLPRFEEERAGHEGGEEGGAGARPVVGGRKRAFETVEVDEIVGNVGRCRCFDAAFLPVCPCSRERWERVHRALFEGRALPPVELGITSLRWTLCRYATATPSILVASWSAGLS